MGNWQTRFVIIHKGVVTNMNFLALNGVPEMGLSCIKNVNFDNQQLKSKYTVRANTNTDSWNRGGLLDANHGGAPIHRAHPERQR